MNNHKHRDDRDDRDDALASADADAAEARLTAYALGELDESECAEVEALLLRDAAARAEVERIRSLAGALRDELLAESEAGAAPGLQPEQRQAIEQQLARPARGGGMRVWMLPAMAAALLIALGVWQLGERRDLGGATRTKDSPVSMTLSPTDSRLVGGAPAAPRTRDLAQAPASSGENTMQAPRDNGAVTDSPQSVGAELVAEELPNGSTAALAGNPAPPTNPGGTSAPGPGAAAAAPSQTGSSAGMGSSKARRGGASTRASPGGTLQKDGSAVDSREIALLDALGYVGSSSASAPAVPAASAPAAIAAPPGSALDGWPALRERQLYFPQPAPGTEGYGSIVENGFCSPLKDPLSTFSIDVDTASYANVRRFLFKDGRLPPADAVRLEELVNYFHYDYPQPAGAAGEGGAPFGVSVAVTECPWASAHRLVRIGLKGREVPVAERAPSNLVFLCDVSGSMDEPDKLPLLVKSLRLLVGQLDARDKVALVTYAGNPGLVLDSTACTPEGKQRLLDALDHLSAGGSTAGAAGIQLAYQVAAAHFVAGGTNRVILSTDGDFNVGISDKDSLGKLITQSAKSGVALSVLGFGTGNLQDGTAETLADKGNGNYAYIDSLAEAQKVLVQQMGGTLITIAKDVKVQVEFNPAKVGSYRLLGYEDRALAAQDFKNDKKDAGEIGSGHTVTALYEVVPVGVTDAPGPDALRYQPPVLAAAPASGSAAVSDLAAALAGAANASPELLYLKLRWKQPDGDTSTEIDQPVTDAGGTLAQAGPDTAFAAAVASFAMLLRDSEHAGDASFDTVLALAERGRGADPDGYRAEFIRMVKVAAGLSGVTWNPEQLKSLGYIGDAPRK